MSDYLYPGKIWLGDIIHLIWSLFRMIKYNRCIPLLDPKTAAAMQLQLLWKGILRKYDKEIYKICTAKRCSDGWPVRLYSG